MSPERKSELDALSLTMLRRYLRAQGWRPLTPASSATDAAALQIFTPISNRNFEMYVLSEKESQDIEILLPVDRSANDFSQRMKGVIRTLSELEGREPSQVISAVRSIGFDVVKSRIPDEYVQEDSIHLVVATNYINRIKSLLAATATTEMQPTPYFLRIKKDAGEYADNCRFGHTFHGSFGFTVESPITQNANLVLFEHEPRPPFERRVIQRFATGISQVSSAVKADDLGSILNNVSSGFSANGYELFADLVEETAYSGMIFDFSFSPEWSAPEQFRAGVEYSVGPLHVAAARAAARSLRAQEIALPAEVAGRITRLQNDSDPSDIFNRTGEREVVVNWSSEDYGDIQVRVTLPPSDYLRALDAHRTGKPVYVSGLLEHIGRRWIIANPTSFSASGE